jgi:hypothetical protein
MPKDAKSCNWQGVMSEMARGELSDLATLPEMSAV